VDRYFKQVVKVQGTVGLVREGKKGVVSIWVPEEGGKGKDGGEVQKS
jgi:hypothetical protein